MKKPQQTGKQLVVAVQRIAEAPVTDDQLRGWAGAVFAGCGGALTIRIVAEAESRELNRRYRGADRPTNVLAFPVPEPVPVIAGEPEELGDLVICASVVCREATEQEKELSAHWAHMVIHGCLHLRGFDHVEPEQTEQMEDKERSILSTFGFADPYE